jgi:hypothetical protein
MFGRTLLVVVALALAACDRVAPSANQNSPAPQLDSPAPDSQPTRTFAASNPAATSATGQLTVVMASRMPDAAHAGDPPQDTLSLRGANNLQVEADLNSAVTPATKVGGQTLRALFALPVEENQVLVYKVTSETKPESGNGICGAGTPAYVVVWEPQAQGEPVLKAMGVMNAAPGAAGAQQCPLLEYRRS